MPQCYHLQQVAHSVLLNVPRLQFTIWVPDPAVVTVARRMARRGLFIT